MTTTGNFSHVFFISDSIFFTDLAILQLTVSSVIDSYNSLKYFLSQQLEHALSHGYLLSKILLSNTLDLLSWFQQCLVNNTKIKSGSCLSDAFCGLLHNMVNYNLTEWTLLVAYLSAEQPSLVGYNKGLVEFWDFLVSLCVSTSIHERWSNVRICSNLYF